MKKDGGGHARVELDCPDILNLHQPSGALYGRCTLKLSFLSYECPRIMQQGPFTYLLLAAPFRSIMILGETSDRCRPPVDLGQAGSAQNVEQNIMPDGIWNRKFPHISSSTLAA